MTPWGRSSLSQVASDRRVFNLLSCVFLLRPLYCCHVGMSQVAAKFVSNAAGVGPRSETNGRLLCSTPLLARVKDEKHIDKAWDILAGSGT